MRGVSFRWSAIYGDNGNLVNTKKPTQEAADAAALAALNEWQKSQKNQLCLNFI